MYADTALERQVKARHGHAAGCRKPIGDCKTCQDNIDWFGALPLATLSEALAEKQNSGR